MSSTGPPNSTRKLTIFWSANTAHMRFCSGSRYADEQTAVHLIGYLNNSDGTGVAGLEKMFESRLDVSSSILSMTGNGLGDPVRGHRHIENQRCAEAGPVGSGNHCRCRTAGTGGKNPA